MGEVRPGVGRGPATTGDDRGAAGAAPEPLPPAGLRVLLPGCAQWGWGQRERGLVLFGSFAASAAVAAFAWGTPTGLVVLGFAFATHVASAADVVRQSAFPGVGLGATLLGVTGGLSAGVYAPLLATAAAVAWPGVRGGSGDGYLVNRWAYRRTEPRRDDWVWYRPTPWNDPRVGKVVAAGGQEVEWSGNRLRVDGQTSPIGSPFRSAWPPQFLAFRVPEGHVLVEPGADPEGRRSAEGLAIVSRGQIAGRAWARVYPVRDRKLLP